MNEERKTKYRYPVHEARMKEDFLDYPCAGCTSKFCANQSYQVCSAWRSWFYRTWKETRNELRKKG